MFLQACITRRAWCTAY